jgi:hypothetical protein
VSEKKPSAPRRLHCRELNGDRTGIIILRDESIELYFVGYDEFVHLSADEPAYVVTEDGAVASLHVNVPGRHTSKSVTTKFGGKDRGRKSNKYRSVCQSGIISNITVIGANAWRPDDLVRRLVFDVAQTERVLRHREKVRSLGRSLHPSDADLTLYRAEGRDVTLTAGYVATYGVDTRSLTAYRPTFSIEFTAGCPLDEIEVHLVRYLAFLSFVLGGRVTPAAVRVDRLSLEEIVRSVEAGTYVGDYKVMWNWPSDEHDPMSLASHGAPFLAEDDSELAAWEIGLAEWINRSNVWERAYIRMTECLRLRHIVSGERLLAAWRWFEELPITGAERAFDDAAVEPVIQAALVAARDQGLADVENRIRGSLRRIGEETMRDRLTRLVSSVREHFDGANLLDGMFAYLGDARDFRGRVAHGHFAARDENEGQRFNKATLAMEALCFLLTARDLPMTDAGRRRIWSHPVLMGYQLAYP